MATAKPPIDWEAVEIDFRAGVLSFAEIGKLHGVSKGRISQVATARGWDRDLSAKIRAKAEAKLNAAALNAPLNADRAVLERQIIEANAERIAQVRGEHRGDIQRVRSLGLSLLAELEGQGASREDLDKLGELMANPDQDGKADKLNEIYHKVISTPSRIDSAKKVAETLKHAIGLEREAYGLDDKKSPGDAPGDITISF